MTSAVSPVRAALAARSQIRAVLSLEVVATREPSALMKLREHPLRIANAQPRSASHTRAVLSSEAVTIRAPSALKPALQISPEWPRSTMSSRPVRASQSRAVRS